ncbi:MAG: glycogen/starch synthase, partial [Desulforhopalus sp.]
MVAQNGEIHNIWMVSREYGNLAGAGGVKDVVCQLAEALAKWNGCKINVVVPLYGFMKAPLQGFVPLPDPLLDDRQLRLSVDMHHPDDEVREDVSFFYQKINGVNIFLVDAERYSQKTDVYVYTDVDERQAGWQKKAMGHHDYFAMNLLLQKATLELIFSLGEQPDIIHCHDGHTALLPALMREIPGYRSYFRATGCLVTIHNAGYGYHQEIADNIYARSITGLSDQIIAANQLDSKFDPFLVAANYAILNTVSENYARELQEGEEDRLTGWLGHELKDRGVILEGVTNGIDPEKFRPAVFAGTNGQMSYDPGDESDSLRGKRYCKEALLAEIRAGLQVDDLEWFG